MKRVVQVMLVMAETLLLIGVLLGAQWLSWHGPDWLMVSSREPRQLGVGTVLSIGVFCIASILGCAAAVSDIEDSWKETG